MSAEDESLVPTFAQPGEVAAVDPHHFPAHEMLADTAYQIVHDETMLDGNSRLNLATFVGTWMEDEAKKVYADAYDKNMIDRDEYPQTAQIEDRCWRMLADLWHAPDSAAAIGTSTIGSSEACMMAGLAFKRRWSEARRAAGKSAERPNLVLSSAVQVCWEKFCNYFDVEPRYVPISPEHPWLDGSELDDYVDECTIGVVVIMGVTYTGSYEPVAEVARVLDDLAARTGLDVPIHIDGASGAMVAPFLKPDLVWDFRLKRVHSINASGHKYGLVYPGVGWVVWRDRHWLPQSLVFDVSYLGGSMPTFALNFSRPGAQVLLQYYQFLRLGRDGYAAVHRASQEVAVYLAQGIAAMEPFELISDGTDLPVFAWRHKPGRDRNWNLYHLSDRLRMKGWLVPAYPLPPDMSDVVVQRIVVRNGLSMNLATDLLGDIRAETAYLESLKTPMPTAGQHPGFTH